MFNCAFTGQYGSSRQGDSAGGKISLSAGDMILSASVTDATIVNGPSLTDLSLRAEKPGSFAIDYDIPKKDMRFQFMNKVNVLNRPLNLTYEHSVRKNRAILGGTLAINPGNNVSVSYGLGGDKCELKYSYANGRGTVIEPSYCLEKKSWNVAVSQRIRDDDAVRATYEASSKVLGVEWSSNSTNRGAYKISASLNLADGVQIPQIRAESTWNFEM
ncbi:hypothetical protein Tsubulata_033463 [Turnera subulata]|uniref:Uncharacterized protein n=1 Tax=Turnera subulata TaxID=218843 RepID=A0A9Q0FZL4_9ROSI|nr:hypothetical protein Tsubulata_033463 [Turnera subulata]